MLTYKLLAHLLHIMKCRSLNSFKKMCTNNLCCHINKLVGQQAQILYIHMQRPNKVESVIFSDTRIPLNPFVFKV